MPGRWVGYWQRSHQITLWLQIDGKESLRQFAVWWQVADKDVNKAYTSLLYDSR